MYSMVWYSMGKYSNSEPYTAPAPNKDQIRFNLGLPGAYLGLVLAGGASGWGN